MIKTLNYGYLPVARSTRYLNSEVLDIISCGNADYAVRETINGGLVAYLIGD